MSLERVLKALVQLGLSDEDAEVYVYLAKEGPQKAERIAETLKIYEQQLTQSLKNLQTKGIVSTTLEHPSQFTAIPFDKALDLLTKAHWKETQNIKENKEEILSQWHAMLKGKTAS